MREYLSINLHLVDIKSIELLESRIRKGRVVISSQAARLAWKVQRLESNLVGRKLMALEAVESNNLSIGYDIV